MTKWFMDHEQNEGCAGGSEDYDLVSSIGTINTETTTGTQNDFFAESLAYFITVGTGGASGDYNVSIDAFDWDAEITGRWRLQRVNSSCAVQESSGSYSSEYTAAGIHTDTISFSPTWATGDVLKLSIETKRVGGHGNQGFSVNSADVDSFVNEPAGAGIAIPIVYHRRKQEGLV